MKKTLSIIVAAAACVSTVSAAWENELAGSTLVGSVVVNDNGTLSLVNNDASVEGFRYTMQTGVTANAADGTVTVTATPDNAGGGSANTAHPLELILSDVAGVSLDNFAISFTAFGMASPGDSGITPWRTFVEVGQSSSEYVQIFAASGAAGLTGKGSGQNDTPQGPYFKAYSPITANTVSNGWQSGADSHDYLLKFELSSGNSHLITLFQDDNLVYQGRLAESAGVSKGPLVVALGGAYSSWDASAGGTYKNIKVYALPEPTTATLSLLALAGLAARRRRK